MDSLSMTVELADRLAHRQSIETPRSSRTSLVMRAKNGDRQAFGDLYEMYLEPIYKYIFYRVSNEADAEDLTELVFLKAWEALERYEEREVPFKSWLYRIAHNAVIDHYRRSKPQVSLETQQPLSDNGQSPEQQVGQNEQLETLTAAIGQLDPLYQQVLSLRFLNGLSHAETSEVVDKSEGAVRVIQYRALKALRALLQE